MSRTSRAPDSLLCDALRRLGQSGGLAAFAGREPHLVLPLLQARSAAHAGAAARLHRQHRQRARPAIAARHPRVRREQGRGAVLDAPARAGVRGAGDPRELCQPGHGLHPAREEGAARPGNDQGAGRGGVPRAARRRRHATLRCARSARRARAHRHARASRTPRTPRTHATRARTNARSRGDLQHRPLPRQQRRVVSNRSPWLTLCSPSPVPWRPRRGPVRPTPSLPNGPPARAGPCRSGENITVDGGIMAQGGWAEVA